jgi:hypothetical protein
MPHYNETGPKGLGGYVHKYNSKTGHTHDVDHLCCYRDYNYTDQSWYVNPRAGSEACRLEYEWYVNRHFKQACDPVCARKAVAEVTGGGRRLGGLGAIRKARGRARERTRMRARARARIENIVVMPARANSGGRRLAGSRRDVSIESRRNGGHMLWVPEYCYDGQLTGDETSVDCGGGLCHGCGGGQVCAINSDCASAVCRGDSRLCMAEVEGGEEAGEETRVEAGEETRVEAGEEARVLFSGRQSVQEHADKRGRRPLQAVKQTNLRLGSGVRVLKALFTPGVEGANQSLQEGRRLGGQKLTRPEIIRGFYHVAALRGSAWEPIVSDQLQSVGSCSLLDVANVSIGFYGLARALATMKNFLKPFTPSISIGHVNSNESSWAELGEVDTLQMVREYCSEGVGADGSTDKWAVYFHSKGVSRNAYFSQTIHWRKYMEYFVLQNPQDCILALRNGYSTCGVDWQGQVTA